MKFVLLGDGRYANAVRQELSRSDAHELTHTVAGFEAADRTGAASPDSRFLEATDGVILADVQPGLLDVARGAAAAGKAVLVLADHRLPPEFIYELLPIDEDRSAMLVPRFSLRCDRRVRALRKSVRSGEAGAVLQLRIDRRVPADAGDGRLMSVGALREALFGDIDLLRQLGGNYNRVLASYSGRQDDGVLEATVTLTGDDLPDAVWTARIADAAQPARRCIEVIGTTGSLDAQVDNPDPQQLLGPLSTDSDRADHSCADWRDLVRLTDLMSAIERSVARRRTIELHFGSTSERSQFKTQMTAIGCGVLTYTIVAMVLFLLINGVMPLPNIVSQIGRVLVFAPLGLFLLAQLFILLTREASP